MIQATLNEQSVVVICMALDCLADDLERAITFAPHDADPEDAEIMAASRIIRDSLTQAFLESIRDRMAATDIPDEVAEALRNLLDNLNSDSDSDNDNGGNL